MAIDDEMIRRVRALIPDKDAIYGDGEDEYLFDDETIEDFLIEGHENVKWAAGLAKIAVGGSEALVLKVITNYETATDGASLMRQWTAAGEALCKQGQAEYEVSEGVGGFFDIYMPDRFNTNIYYQGEAAGYPIGW